MSARDLRSDTGESLVETLVALAILGVAAAAILAGIQLSTAASDIHRKQSTGGAYVRSYAEAVQDYVATPGANNYLPCAGPDAYNVAAVTSQLNLPAGFTAHHAAAVPLTSTGQERSCPDPGVQKLKLTVRSDDGRADELLTIIVRSPCDPSAPCSG